MCTSESRNCRRFANTFPLFLVSNNLQYYTYTLPRPQDPKLKLKKSKAPPMSSLPSFLQLPPSSTYAVTGATKGIGLEIARLLLGASPSSRVLICSRNHSEVVLTVAMLSAEVPPLVTTSGETQDRVFGVACDLSTDEGRATLVSGLTEAFGPTGLTGLINNVGTNVRKDFLSQTSAEYSSIFQTNVDSAYHLTKLSSPLLFKCASSNPSTGSVVVNVSSAAGVSSTGSGVAYAMSKSALLALTRGLACEWAKSNVRVNAVAPWTTYTPMLAAAVSAFPSALDKVKAWTPMGRLAEPAEIAGPVLFLCLPGLSSYVTGTCINADGGLNAQGFEGPCITQV